MEKVHTSRATLLLLALVPVVCLAPFAGKAFHVDDLPFLWQARQILQHPFDFYGFSANWYGFDAPMYLMNQNPPLVSYYIALAAVLLGWSELAFHLAFLVPAMAVCLGTYYLAVPFCRRPYLAALIAIFTPVFLVSATSVMCDVLMLAFYVCSAALWVHGLEDEKWSCLFLAVICISLATLTKYFAISMVPLLFVYSLARTHSVGRWLFLLLIPIAVLVGYEMLTYRLYGTGLLAGAASYAVVAGQTRGWDGLVRGLIGLSFTGGCLAAAAFYAPILWPRRAWVTGLAALAVLTGILVSLGNVGSLDLKQGGGIRWGVTLELALFTTAGLHVLLLAGTDLWKRRDPAALLLFLWIFGTFTFTTFLNWSTNARTVLPMVPALGILVVRRLDEVLEGDVTDRLGSVFYPMIPAAVLALSVTWADFSLAESQRLAARSILADYKGYNHTIWFQGHWGFQYYMEAGGAKPLDFRSPVFEEGDLMVVPSNNSNLSALTPDMFRLTDTRSVMPFRWIGTVQKHLGAGFYSDRWGPLPFAFGSVKPETYEIFVVGRYAEPNAEAR
ncbi:MAG: glycosyltransferase family 39 protein [Desulfomonile tiedjei]|nr:glycosyltransferase family 39 protein [Desulfomonile tiedjei]